MNKKHIGSDFDDFLAEEAMLQETTAVAIKRVIAWQIAQEMQTQHLTKTALAKKMNTSRTALNPDGHFKFPHPWPPQTPPGKTAGL